jgi:photosystem II stability/assembly factor-like uncharacterized protein
MANLRPVRILLTIACLGLVLLPLVASAQGFSFQRDLSRPDTGLTFHDIQRQAERHFGGLPAEALGRGSGYKQYKRWEWFWEPRVRATGRFPDPNHNWREWSRFIDKNGALLADAGAAAWRPLGPSQVPPQGNDGLGRLNCIAFHPTDPNTFWVGAPAGGLWKTTDFGESWTCNTDQLPVLGVSDIAIDPRDPNVMYIATGDGDQGSLSGVQTDQRFVQGDTRSIGVLRTTNGGVTWQPTGLRFEASELVLIRRLLIDPASPSTLLAASTIGVLRTDDAGGSWRIVAPGYFMDLEYHPTNPSIVYAATAAIGGDGSAFYRSIDGGMNWEGIIGSQQILRMKIGVTPQRPNRVDLLCASLSGGLGGIFASADAGQTFNASGYVPDTLQGRPNLLGWFAGAADDLGGQGSYDLAYAISPDDPYEMFVGGVNTWKTSDGGATWGLANFWSVYPWDSAFNSRIALAHADKHFLRYHPLKPDHLFECNDGGLWYTSNRGSTWTNISSGLQIGQIYRIASSPFEDYTVLAGHQDNATWMLDQGQWRQAGVGDGMEVAVDRFDRNLMYRVGQNGSIARSRRRLIEFADHSTLDQQALSSMNISGNIPGFGRQFQGAWLTPFVIDPVAPNVLYTGMYHVFKSVDYGDTWQAISPLNTSLEKQDQDGNPLPLHVRTLAVSPTNTNVIWAGTFEDISVTLDGGLSWGLVGLRTSQSFAVTSLTADPVNPSLVLVTLSGYDPVSKVIVLDVQGNGVNLTRNLPNVPVNCAAFDVGAQALFIGTDLGVFVLDLSVADAPWVPYGEGLPRVVVTDLDVHQRLGVLRAATFGRGLWETTLPGVSAVPAEEQRPTRVRPLDGGVFELSLDELAPGEHAVVYDYLGQEVMRLDVASARERIDLSGRPAGVYFLGLRSEGYRTLERLVRAK